jgi:hypothetical protein
MVAVRVIYESVDEYGISSSSVSKEPGLGRDSWGQVRMVDIKALVNNGYPSPCPLGHVPCALGIYIGSDGAAVQAVVVPLPLLCVIWVGWPEPLRHVLDHLWLGVDEGWIFMEIPRYIKRILLARDPHRVQIGGKL